MQHVMRRPADVVSLTVFVLAMAGAPQVMAHSHPNHLRGDYAFSVSADCAAAVDPNGFDGDLKRIGAGHTNIISVAGVLHYNGDGTGNSVQQNLRVNPNATAAGQFPVEQADVTCDLTYAVNDDHNFSQQLTCNSTTVAGFGAGTTGTSSIQIHGVIGRSGEVLILGDTIPDNEVFTRSDGSIVHSLCGRKGTAVQIP
jgi:hypothetical protein